MDTGKPKNRKRFTKENCMNTKTKELAYIALMTAVISVLAPISLPMVGEVPISLATLAVMLSGVLLGSRNGAAAAALYLVLGAIGVPVFAGSVCSCLASVPVFSGFPCRVFLPEEAAASYSASSVRSASESLDRPSSSSQTEESRSTYDTAAISGWR